ncbi:hypothetical protein BYT27DRAFT_7116338 [Phlegmacium glaucopus]|nr:hypothetical protein BYT27DRAFT_7116338 [Phlegmacium glaucopus]
MSPPPIFEILSDKTLEAAKSAVITTALTWFFNNLPVDVFPPPMRPDLILLQRLVPLLGYIGSLISWSWSTIRVMILVRYGVTLTATWVLPVALIPGTWYEQNFPKSASPSSPIPLPRPLSIQSFVPPTPPTDHPRAYVTPMSSMAFGSPARPPTVNGENWELDSSLASSSPP